MGKIVDVISLAQAAKELRVSYLTAFRMVHRGELPAAKIGGQWRVRAETLKRLVSTKGA